MDTWFNRNKLWAFDSWRRWLRNSRALFMSPICLCTHSHPSCILFTYRTVPGTLPSYGLCPVYYKSHSCYTWENQSVSIEIVRVLGSWIAEISSLKSCPPTSKKTVVWMGVVPVEWMVVSGLKLSNSFHLNPNSIVGINHKQLYIPEAKHSKRSPPTAITLNCISNRSASISPEWPQDNKVSVLGWPSKSGVLNPFGNQWKDLSKAALACSGFFLTDPE